MRIYRIEHDDGIGCYWRKSENDPLQPLKQGIYIGSWHGDDTHPSPFKDIGRRIESKEKCGFASILQLWLWFTEEWLDILAALGYKIACYECDEVTQGTYQVIYNANKAALVCKNDIVIAATYNHHRKKEIM